MSMSKWPGFKVTGTNASDIMNKLNSGPLRRGGEVNKVLSKLGPRMIDNRPEYSTLVFDVVNGKVSLTSVSPEGDEELSSGADQLVTIFQDAKHKPGPYGKNIMNDDTNVTVTLSTKKIGLNEMKITRKQLRQIIKEELSRLDEIDTSLSHEDAEFAYDTLAVRLRGDDNEVLDREGTVQKLMTDPAGFEDMKQQIMQAMTHGHLKQNRVWDTAKSYWKEKLGL
jgi:hypothetical protein